MCARALAIALMLALSASSLGRVAVVTTLDIECCCGDVESCPCDERGEIGETEYRPCGGRDVVITSLHTHLFPPPEALVVIAGAARVPVGEQDTPLDSRLVRPDPLPS